MDWIERECRRYSILGSMQSKFRFRSYCVYMYIPYVQTMKCKLPSLELWLSYLLGYLDSYLNHRIAEVKGP